MAYKIQADTGDVHVFIVGLSLEPVEFKSTKLKFLAGIGYAIYVAAFEMDEGQIDQDVIINNNSFELDTKEFYPNKIITPVQSQISLDPQSLNIEKSHGVKAAVEFGSIKLTSIETTAGPRTAYEVKTGDEAKEASTGANETDLNDAMYARSRKNSVAQSVASEDGSKEVVAESADLKPVAVATGTTSAEKESVSAASDSAAKDSCAHSGVDRKSETAVGGMKYNFSVPTWEPTDSFSFPVARLPVLNVVPDNLTLDDFSDVKHVADGSNANVFIGRFQNQNVIIKMIKAQAEFNDTAVHEFELEHGLLSRISHPNIIKIFGAGRTPRRFLVIEWLGGGSLTAILDEHQMKPGITGKLFRKPSFTYPSLISKARDMADAFDYLHRRCHPGAMILHRGGLMSFVAVALRIIYSLIRFSPTTLSHSTTADLKPDNVGFAQDGTLKLFDFGLVRCVNERGSDSEQYKMTGYTGSLRYMAPEVALKKPYTEKVDVHSFGILLWQMAADKVPFKGFNKDDYMTHVVHNNYRPKIDSNWPAEFGDLLRRCWDPNPLHRPDFRTIVEELDALMPPGSKAKTPQNVNRRKIGDAKNEKFNTQSSWF